MKHKRVSFRKTFKNPSRPSGVMGGKRLKFPRRPKYVPKEKEQETAEESKISEEEHKNRVERLKELGIVK